MEYKDSAVVKFKVRAAHIREKLNRACPSLKEQWKELSNEDLEPPPEHTPPPPRPPKRTSEMHNGRMHEHSEFFPKQQAVEEEMRCSVSSVEEAVPDSRARSAAPLSTDR